MRCKDIQTLMIDSTERSLKHEEHRAVKQHTAKCSACARFQDDLKKIRLCLEKMPAPALPAELDEKTRLMCHEERVSCTKTNRQSVLQAHFPAIPRFIWGALIALIVLTVVLLVPSLRDISMDQTMPFPDVLVLTLILQNAITLILTPVIVRKYRSPKQGLRVN